MTKTLWAAVLSIAVATHAADSGGNSAGMKMTPIPAGAFTMGSPSGAREETPAHQVQITRPFSIGATEVTRGQWKAVMGADAPDMGLKDQTDQHPVVGITWFEAVEFCRRLSAKEGKTYRLPTEAEWEYACRAGTNTAYSFGARLSSGQVWCEDPPLKGQSAKRTRTTTKTVGSFPANAWGLHEMHGNVFEWCYDFFDGDTYVKEPLRRLWSQEGIAAEEIAHRLLFDQAIDWNRDKVAEGPLGQALKIVHVDPLGPERGNAEQRVVRGGCWMLSPLDCSSSARRGADSAWSSRAIGFRVVCENGDDGLSRNMRLPKPPGTITVDGFGPLPEIFVSRLGIRFQLVLPGRFLQGELPELRRLTKHQGIYPPLRPVTMTRPFYLAITPVSQWQASTAPGGIGTANTLLPGQWQLDDRDYPGPYMQQGAAGDGYFPDYELLLRWCLAERRGYRFPTAAEYEYAARAGTTGKYYWKGDDKDGWPYEWYGGAGNYGFNDSARPVGIKRPNPWGFFDMCGNRWQWTSTLIEKAYTADPVTDPIGPDLYAKENAAMQTAVMGHGYRYGSFGLVEWVTKFDDYRACGRWGGMRPAMDVQWLKPVAPDQESLTAFSRQIEDRRFANFLRGARHFLARQMKRNEIAVISGEYLRSVHFYASALELRPGDKVVGEELRSEVIPWVRQVLTKAREKGDATNTAGLESALKRAEELALAIAGL